MPSDSYLRERRKHDRFVVRKLAIAVPNTPTSQIAKIVNISKGGIAVRYLEQKNWLKNADTIDILVNSNFMMNNIPIKNVNDFKVTNPVSFSIISERQCCLQFGALSPEQELLLNEFIAKYGAGTA
jgi:hypothetical protein